MSESDETVDGFNLEGRRCEFREYEPPNARCENDAVTVLREAGARAMAGWRPAVCMDHRTYLLSEEVRAAGRVWEVIHDEF